ncbi:hypothethical protein (plasmid) [Ralstonia solanacearum CMR15]|nr:hypothethical protein [Ralstonia solanacearum CMR15]
MRIVLPFLGWEIHRGKTYRAYVDCRYVLGASLKGLPEHGAWGGDARAHLALCKHASIDDWRPLYLAQAVPDSDPHDAKWQEP